MLFNLLRSTLAPRSNPSILTVTVGDVTLLADDATEQVFPVVRQIPHENYNSNNMEHDIMLIELDISAVSCAAFHFVVCNVW